MQEATGEEKGLSKQIGICQPTAVDFLEVSWLFRIQSAEMGELKTIAISREHSLQTTTFVQLS